MTYMKLRRTIIPRTIGDTAAFVFLITVLPFFYWFEVFIVLPAKYTPEFSFWYVCYVVWFTFLLVNIVSNLTYLILTDCSIRGEMMPATLLPSWKFCDICECVTPPRSWHCDICKICILKRDHHCHFSACCIGHNNHRFFLIFLLYMVVATVHVTIFNATFVFQNEIFNLWLLLRLTFPLAVLALGVDVSLEYCCILIFIVSVLGMIACIALLVYHSGLMFKGIVMHESSHKIYDFDLGSIKENMIQVLGERWYLTWISPFIRSELPCDGINWSKVKLLTTKSK